MPHTPEYPESASTERLNSLLDYMDGMSSDPYTEQLTAQFDAAATEAIRTMPLAKEAVLQVLRCVPGQNEQYIAEFLQRDIRAIEREYTDAYTVNRTEPSHWLEVWQLLEDPVVRAKFHMNAYRPIQSNIAERAKLFQLAMVMHGIDTEVTTLEYGCSENHIGKMLAQRNNPELAYQSTAVMNRRKNGIRNVLVADKYVGQLISKVLEKPFSLKQHIGLDLFSPDDPAVKAWVEVCSSYLSEVGDADKEHRFDLLQNLRLSQVTFSQQDIISFSLEDYDAIPAAEELPRAIIISFSAYMLANDQERQRTLIRAVDIVNANDDEALVLVLDDIQSIDQDHAPKMKSRKRDFSSCGLWVYSNHAPEGGFQKYFSVKSGRCEAVIPETGILSLALKNAL